MLREAVSAAACIRTPEQLLYIGVALLATTPTALAAKARALRMIPSRT